MPDGTVTEMMRVADDYTLNLIKREQEKGSIRDDIDAGLLKLYLLGATTKIKEYILNETESLGFDITDDRMKGFEATAEKMVDMLKNGIGVKHGDKHGNTKSN
jgi:hypothetical protein